MANEKSLAAIALALLSTAALSACSSKLEDIEEEGILRIYEVEKVARECLQVFLRQMGYFYYEFYQPERAGPYELG